MCCFSRSVPFVGGTKIFARGLPNGEQLLAYAMSVELGEELAMILPLPVALGSGDDAVRFIDLEGEEGFFQQLATAFPIAAAGGFQPLARGAPPRQKLEVVEVGQYEASFVPTSRDFDRLDARFRLPRGFLEALPQYTDFGFAVFRLKPGRNLRQNVQPMALSFARREARALFFPTVHVHDGKVTETAAFDHALYCQADGVLGATLGWTQSTHTLGQHVNGARSRALIDATASGFTMALWGSLPNHDVWLREPADVTLADLHGAGPSFSYQVKASAAYPFGMMNPEYAGWVSTASQRLSVLCRALREGLAELTLAKKEAWRLGPLSPQLPPHFMNGHQLWRGTSYMDGAPAGAAQEAQVRFTPFSKRVEPQQVSLGFEKLPSQELALGIQQELSRLLDRAFD